MFKSLYLWLLIVAVLLLSVQILAVMAYAYSFIPYPAFWSDPFLKGVEPQRQPLFYALFLIVSIVLMAMGVKWLLPRLNSSDNRRKFKFWLVLEGIWCFLMVFYFFKWTTYRYPFWTILPYENSTWLQAFFCVTCGLAILSKVFFPEVENLYRYLEAFFTRSTFPRVYTIALQVIFMTGVILLLYIPRPQDVVALALVWDQWNHLDPVTGWFIRHGWYISYEETIQILVMMAIAYIIGLFYFIRCWLKSWLLAIIGALLTIKMGMFYYGSAPCIWINPANTFLAHGWDIILYLGLWYISAKHPKKFDGAAVLVAVIIIGGWLKSQGLLNVFGLDNQPMMAPLRVRQFFPFLMGYFVPVFYVFSLLLLMGSKNTQQLRLPKVMCIYGLMIFINYLERPMIGFYGSLMVPAILIMLWWLNQLFLLSTLVIKRTVYAGIAFLCLGALLTNRLMLIYPNIIFQDQGRFTQERAVYEHFDAMAQPALLIQQLTKEGEKIALLSNFETALLLQSHRQSLFENSPVMFSALNENPGGLNLRTKKECLGLIDNLTKENVGYVFVDARLLALPSQVLGDSGLNAVLNYVRSHYQIYAHQGFLVALQRR